MTTVVPTGTLSKPSLSRSEARQRDDEEPVCDAGSRDSPR